MNRWLVLGFLLVAKLCFSKMRRYYYHFLILRSQKEYEEKGPIFIVRRYPHPQHPDLWPELCVIECIITDMERFGRAFNAPKSLLKKVIKAILGVPQKLGLWK